MKRFFVFFTAVVLALPVQAAWAQNGTWRATETSSRPRQAVQPQPQPVVVVTPAPSYQPVYYPGYYNGTPYPVAVTSIPAIVMSDGSVWANFGYGYEPVSRQCVVAAPTQPVVVAGNGLVISGGAPPPTYMQPAPAQLTPSQQMLSSNRPTVLSPQAQAACFSSGANGTFVIIR